MITLKTEPLEAESLTTQTALTEHVMKSTIPVLLLVFLLTACGSNGEAEYSEPHTYMEIEADQAHNARNSLDYYGTYSGVVPCADCAGIDTTVELLENDTFIFSVRYRGKEDDTVHRYEGEFTWNDAGNTVTLWGLEDRPDQFFVAENMLIQLDMDGNRITGEHADAYILEKEPDR